MSSTNTVDRGGQSLPIQSGITAGTTDSQIGSADAPLIAGYNVVSASASNTDAVQLPKARVGLVVNLKNADSAQDIKVWPFSGDSVNGGTVDAADTTALGEGADRTYICSTEGDWDTFSA